LVAAQSLSGIELVDALLRRCEAAGDYIHDPIDFGPSSAAGQVVVVIFDVGIVECAAVAESSKLVHASVLGDGPQPRPQLVGLTGRIRGVVSDLAAWEPDFPISAVVCAAAALQELTPQQRQKALSILQAATKDGGVHVVETSSDGVRLVPLEELEASYYGWQTMVEGTLGNETFSARKAVA